MPYKLRHHFSATYGEARQKFLEAASSAGAPVKSYHLPGAKGPDGEELYTDVARLGPHEAEHALVISSGTHGIEGFCGSGAQIGFLREDLYRELPPDTAFVLIHAMNPFGFAHLRRVNENNVDLNRNFVDHHKPPKNPGYEKIHKFLVPDDWDGPSRARADEELNRFAAEEGPAEFQAAVSIGQYKHEDGLFFGGKKAVWSNQNWRRIMASFLTGGHAHFRRIVHIDFHTGLGPYGYGEPIFIGEHDSDSHAWATYWYGDDVKSIRGGESVSARVMGDIFQAYEGSGVPGERICIGLEFGTVPMNEVLTALRADNWLYARGEGDTQSVLGRAIKQDMRAAFYPDRDDWRQAVWQRGVELLMATAAGFRSE